MPWGSTVPPEMAVPDGYGRFLAESNRDATECRIERADPLILVTAVLVEDVWTVDDGSPPYIEFDGKQVVITGTNQRVIYVIGRYLPDIECYEAQWPD